MTLRTALIEDFACVEPSDGELFQTGSISKAVTALAAVLLVDEDVLDLDRDVNDDLRSWRMPADGVTLRQLLSHTSGTSVEFFAGSERGAQVPSAIAVLEREVRVDASARGSFRYSGGGYLVVQLLLADATRLPFAVLARELVLEPLAMRDSTFEQPLPSALHARATRDDWHVYPEAAAAGLWTTPTDLARFAIALQLALAGRQSPIPDAVARQMVEPHAAIPPSADADAIRSLGLAPPEAVGLGLFLAEGGRRFGHFGGAHGFTSAFDVSATDGSGAVVLSDLHNGFEAVLPALAAALAAHATVR